MLQLTSERVAMSAFPMILERSCRDKALTSLQMKRFRQAWHGVSALLIADPAFGNVSNNKQEAPFRLIERAFPHIHCNHPKVQERYVLTTPRYLTPKFAEDLASVLLCPAERTLPEEEFFEEANSLVLGSTGKSQRCGAT